MKKIMICLFRKSSQADEMSLILHMSMDLCTCWKSSQTVEMSLILYMLMDLFNYIVY